MSMISLSLKGNKAFTRSFGHWFVLQAVASAAPDPLVFIDLCNICTVGGCLKAVLHKRQLQWAISLSNYWGII